MDKEYISNQQPATDLTLSQGIEIGGVKNRKCTQGNFVYEFPVTLSSSSKFNSFRKREETRSRITA